MEMHIGTGIERRRGEQKIRFRFMVVSNDFDDFNEHYTVKR